MSRVPSISRLKVSVAAIGFLVALASSLGADIYSARSAALQQAPAGPLGGAAVNFDYLGTVALSGDFNGDGFDDLAATERETGTEMGSVHVVYGSATGLDAAGDQIWQDFDPSLLLLDREPGDLFGWALASGDFDGDGDDDLAIGVPGEAIDDPADPDDIVHAGVVLVIYGSPTGLQTGEEAGSRPARRFQLGTAGLGGGPPTAEESFGSVLASGDFSGDGFDDLAIGIPERKSATGELNAGALVVIYGTLSGLSTSGHRFLDQDSDIGAIPMVGNTSPSDFFGWALAAGDFDDDGRDDLAVGVPGEQGDVPSLQAMVGAVQVLYGTLGTGLLTADNQLWHEGNVDTGSPPELGDQFGYALVAGDLTDDGAADLVVGSPFEDLGAIVDAGAVTYLLGGAGLGISIPGSEIFFESDFPVSNNPGTNDYFGAALAIGDFVDDVDLGRHDLAIGIPSDNVWNGASSVADVGSAIVTIGGPALGPSSATFWAPGRNGLAGETTAAQAFGSSFAAGDFDGDGHGDLVVGSPQTDQPGISSPGALFYVRGALFSDDLERHDATAWSFVFP